MGNLEKIMWWSSHAKIWSQRKYYDKLIHSRLMSLIKIELVLISTSLNWIKSIMLISIQGNTVKICLISTTNGEKVVSFLLVLIFSIMNCMVIPLCAANELSAFLASAVTFNTDYIQDQLLILTFSICMRNAISHWDLMPLMIMKELVNQVLFFKWNFYPTSSFQGWL